jgi:septal ring factor EnvC (AmiA/AmiB activator)
MPQAAQIVLPTEAEAVAPSGLELVISKALDPVEIFTSNGLDPILERIKNETLSIALDMSTIKGRKEIASLAHKVAVSKTTLDKLGKDLVSGWKEKAKKVDVERARAWDRLETLQKQVRQPLTEWEDADKQRVTRHEANLAEIVNSGPFTLQNWQTLSVEVMRDRLAEVQKDAELDWQEFSVKAKAAIESASKAINSAIEKRKEYDAEQTELARLRKEEAERKQREHEERLKAEAAEKARITAEEKARREAEAEAKRVAAEKAKAEQERLRIQREKEEAEARAAKAEADRIASEQRAARDKAPHEQAKAIVAAIARGEVPHIVISY